MSTHAPKVDLGSKLFFLVSAVALALTVYVLVSSLVNTYNKNSVEGEQDNSMKVAAVADNLKPIGITATSDAPIAGAAGRSGKEIYDAVCTSCHATGVLDSPKLGDKAAWEARASIGLDGLIASAAKGKGSMPANGGDPSITESELKAVILYMTKESGLDLGGAEESAKPIPEKKDDEVVTTKEEITAETKTDTPKDSNAVVAADAPLAKTADTLPTDVTIAATPSTATPSIDGEKVYASACFACHASGVAGSPILGDKAAWAPRIETGVDTLYTTALKGKGAMPPKGGNMSLSDEKVKAAVDYMISQVQ